MTKWTVMADPALNATAASLLGFLRAGPMTGWDLDQRVKLSIGNFWNVTRSQIYRELRVLTERDPFPAHTRRFGIAYETALLAGLDALPWAKPAADRGDGPAPQ